MGWSGALHDPSVCRWCPQATTVGDVRPMAMSFITLVLPASTTSRYPAGRRGEFSSDQLLPKYTGLPRLTSPNGGWRRSQRWTIAASAPNGAAFHSPRLASSAHRGTRPAPAVDPTGVA